MDLLPSIFGANFSANFHGQVYNNRNFLNLIREFIYDDKNKMCLGIIGIIFFNPK